MVTNALHVGKENCEILSQLGASPFDLGLKNIARQVRRRLNDGNSRRVPAEVLVQFRYETSQAKSAYVTRIGFSPTRVSEL
jgi:hypothetical protein